MPEKRLQRTRESIGADHAASADRTMVRMGCRVGAVLELGAPYFGHWRVSEINGDHFYLEPYPSQEPSK